MVIHIHEILICDLNINLLSALFHPFILTLLHHKAKQYWKQIILRCHERLGIFLEVLGLEESRFVLHGAQYKFKGLGA